MSELAVLRAHFHKSEVFTHEGAYLPLLLPRRGVKTRKNNSILARNCERREKGGREQNAVQTPVFSPRLSAEKRRRRRRALFSLFFSLPGLEPPRCFDQLLFPLLSQNNKAARWEREGRRKRRLTVSAPVFFPTNNNKKKEARPSPPCFPLSGAVKPLPGEMRDGVCVFFLLSFSIMADLLPNPASPLLFRERERGRVRDRQTDRERRGREREGESRPAVQGHNYSSVLVDTRLLLLLLSETIHTGYTGLSQPATGPIKSVRRIFIAFTYSQIVQRIKVYQVYE